MTYAYPPLAPVLTGNVITTHNLLKDPTSVQRRIEDLARHGFVSDILFPIGVEAPGGAISYSMTEPVRVADDPISVAPGGQYQLALATGGAPQLAKVTKYGQDSRVTDEDIGRLKINAAERAMTQLVNATIDFIDTLALGIAAAAVTQTQAAVAVWNNASADPFKDILRAKAKVKNLNPTLGYEPDLLVVSSLLYAELVGNDKVVAGLQVNNQNVVVDGMVMQIAGVRLTTGTSRSRRRSTRATRTASRHGPVGTRSARTPTSCGTGARSCRWWRTRTRASRSRGLRPDGGYPPGSPRRHRRCPGSGRGSGRRRGPCRGAPRGR